MSDLDLTNFLLIAKESAKKSGQFLLTKRKDCLKVDQELLHDIKIEADCQSEKIIIDFLEQESNFSILSEEKGFVEGTNSDYQWIVDPIDGSLNYFRDIPMCCVSVGLWYKKKPLLGVVYDFQKDEFFYGIVGKQSYLNDVPINVSKTSAVHKAVLCSGFPGKTDYSTEGINKLILQIQQYRKIRFLGSAALSIAYVACGRADAYYENDIMIWDVAGAIPLVLGSGGNLQLEEMDEPNRFRVLVTNGIIETKF